MGGFAESKVQMNSHEIGKILNINRCMVILVLYVGYRRGLHFIYLFAVLIATNTVVFCQRVLILKRKKKKNGNFCHVKRSYSNKTTKRSTYYCLRNVFLKLKSSLMLLILYCKNNKAQSID